ncbi:hypothetical protein B0H13DRAFT_1976209 [Mycena leptocephala]|nr:hypothetical protein B0H13DRAFT_1976209 [Mycena leptocephala]
MDTETPFRANVGAMGSQKYEAVDPVDLQAGPSRGHNYPPDYSHMSIPLSNLSPLSSRANTLRPDPALRYDPERAPGMPTGSGSWKKIEHSYQEFDPARDATEAHLAFADGDIPNNQASKLYNYLLNVSIVSRWIVFIVPVMVWGVGLLWWSIWLSVCWGGWWTALAASMILPRIIRRTIGVIAVGTRRYLDWLQVLHRYVAIFLWTLAIFISYNPLINARQKSATPNSVKIIDLGQKLFFAFLVCAAVLLFEKFSIQWIAGSYHEKSYAERIADQKFAVKSLVTLYRNSKNVGRPDALRADSAKDALNPRQFFKRALEGVRNVATTTTTAFGNVASEIAGSSVLQPNSPQSIVLTALESANQSRLLARRLFYSFAKPNTDYMLVEDVAPFFPTSEEADLVFALFDQDSNGDASRDEVEMAVMEFHREQQSIEHSMQDLDSAVGRLDNIFMSLYVVIAILIVAVALEAQVATLVTSAGTLVLTSIIFLFIKHPFDVGDRVVINSTSYTVKEIHLLSTIFIDSDGGSVQAPNTVLNGKCFIQNIRRSPQMSESFTFDVNYTTTFENVESLRQKMLTFVTTERRDFHPAFDIVVVGPFPRQAKMTLQADIKYKSNGQQGHLKVVAKRRNKWLCALKAALAEVGIYGPSGNPHAEPGTQRYTECLGTSVQAPAGGWKLSGKDSVIREFVPCPFVQFSHEPPPVDGTDDIFGDPDEVCIPHMTSPRRQGEPRQPVTMPTASTFIPPSSSLGPPH